MIEVVKSEEFVDWLAKLRDRKAALNIARRVDRIADGNFGYVERLTPRVSEIKINMGKGYRIYYSKFGNKVVILLAGGDKSTQKKDIKKAEKILTEERSAGYGK
jgi:putative addiction module killer protein